MSAAAFLLLLSLAPAASAKEDCYPPNFYVSLPRDRENYYGVAKDTDTDRAREQAIRNLGKQVTGDLEGWDQKKLDEIAGPGHDRWELAADVGKALPHSALLAGWEQDGFDRCDGYSYVLVRIEKERVDRFVRGSAQFKQDVAAMLSKRLDKVEADVSALTSRIEKIERGLGCLKVGGKPTPDGEAAAKAVAEARADLNAGKPRAQVEAKLAAAEDAYAKLEKRMSGYQANNDAAESARLSALKKEKAPELKAKLAAFDSGKWTFVDAFGVLSILRDEKDDEGVRKFARGLLARPDKKNLGTYEDNFAYQVIVSDLQLKDEKATLADGENFLKTYPSSNLFQAVKAEMDGQIAMARMPKTAPVAPDPCATR